MADTEFTIDCAYSGQREDFEYDDESSLSQLINDLQHESFAWPKGKDTDTCGINVDGTAHSYHGNETKSLSELGVKDGSVIRILSDITQAF